MIIGIQNNDLSITTHEYQNARSAVQLFPPDKSSTHDSFIKFIGYVRKKSEWTTYFKAIDGNFYELKFVDGDYQIDITPTRTTLFKSDSTLCIPKNMI